jgi:transposase
MIGPGLLDSESRRDLIDLARDPATGNRRANALVLLDDGLSCEVIGKVLFLDGETIYEWHELYLEDGVERLAPFNYEGGSSRLTVEQQDKLKSWIGTALPRTTSEVGAWIAAECGIEYQTRSGLIALLHRLGMEHHKPKAISRKLDPAKQAAFTKGYEDLMNRIFADAAHTTHVVGCWRPKEVSVAIEKSSGRDGLNIHGAIDLETGQTIMKDVLMVDALSTILLLAAIETTFPWTMPDTIARNRSRRGCRDPSAELNFTTFRLTVHTSFQLNVYGDRQ